MRTSLNISLARSWAPACYERLVNGMTATCLQLSRVDEKSKPRRTKRNVLQTTGRAQLTCDALKLSKTYKCYPLSWEELCGITS